MKIIITGSGGFIGAALRKRIIKRGHTVFTYPRKDADLFFHFGSPSSNILFDHALSYCVDETITGFINAIKFCRENAIKLVYPSSATVYSNTTNYAHTKSALEEIHSAYGGDILGLRIFTGYGVGEEHKGDYASIAYQFCKLMKEGKSPSIYGDGSQTRDFVYIDDIVDTMLLNIHENGLIDIGTGVCTSFNRIVEIINSKLKTNIVPTYIQKPSHYIEETVCREPIKNSISIEQGIENILRLT